MLGSKDRVLSSHLSAVDCGPALCVPGVWGHSSVAEPVFSPVASVLGVH